MMMLRMRTRGKGNATLASIDQVGGFGLAYVLD
jgi:hypothetical protein